jgi:nodulation protein E
LVLGEGAAILVLETLEHAKRRSAAIYAEICGFGMSADAQDLIAPDLNGAVRAMKAALNDAKLDLSSISYVNAHGTATRANDRTETLALKTLFGIHSGSLAISSNKGVMGHCLGSAGALEAAATALTLKSQIAPPTANYREADPECDLDYIPGSARNLQIKAAISNSFAFGGLNAVLALRQFI